MKTLELHTNLYDLIAEDGEALDAAVCEAAYLALLQLGDDIFELEWANKYASLAVQTLAKAA